MTVPALIVALIVNYGTPDGQVVKMVEPMPDLKTCLQTVNDLALAAGPEIQQLGFSVACYVKLTGDPA